MISAHELARYRTYVGRTEVRKQFLDADSLRRFAAAVGSSLDVERDAPVLAHWAYFLDCVQLSELGRDGHLSAGMGILPPVKLPRRMFAASSIRFEASLQLNREAELKLTVAEVTHKAGKSGDLVLIDVDRSLTQDGSTKVVERQTLVYAGEQKPDPVLPIPKSPAGPDQSSWIPSSVELMRFSAATFNAHRIHYDRSYAQVQEGYPALVVQGPLTAAKLCAFAQAKLGKGASPSSFKFRALAPLFADQAVQFEIRREDGRIEAMRCDGVAAMCANVGFRTV